MQVIFLPPWLAIVLSAVVWPLVQVPISALGNKIPDEKFNPGSFWFRSRSWETDGRFYERFLRIKKWKDRLPDGARLFRTGFEKGKVKSTDPEYLKAFIRETCRADRSLSAPTTSTNPKAV